MRVLHIQCLYILIALLPLSACADSVIVHTLHISKTIKAEIVEINIKQGENNETLPNGNIIFGAAREPKTYVSKIIFEVDGKSYRLNSKYMYNAWGDRPVEIPKTIKYFDAHCYDKENCTIRGLFSDAGGSFVAEWKIINGQPIRTVITDSSDIVDMFVKNISPPVFE